jgi:hypothetical protein
MKKGKRKSTSSGTAAMAKNVPGRIKRQRIAKSGLTSRIRGHVSARGRRAQARRDTR